MPSSLGTTHAPRSRLPPPCCRWSGWYRQGSPSSDSPKGTHSAAPKHATYPGPPVPPKWSSIDNSTCSGVWTLDTPPQTSNNKKEQMPLKKLPQREAETQTSHPLFTAGSLPRGSKWLGMACQRTVPGFNPRSGKIPHASGQLSPRTLTTQPEL